MPIGLAHDMRLHDVARNFNEMLARRGEPPPLPHHLIPEWEWQWNNLCLALDRFAAVFQRRYDVWRRKGYYWLERRERELWREYIRRMHALSDSSGSVADSRAIQKWFDDERSAIARERRQHAAEHARRGSRRLDRKSVV